MLLPFHLSFVVTDKAAIRKFYTEVLGCPLGRETEAWLDILFFGHQLTVHQATSRKPAVKIDHFGAILEKGEWQEMVARCSDREQIILMQPSIRHHGEDRESGKFKIRDPAGNILELKYYVDFSAAMASQCEST